MSVAAADKNYRLLFAKDSGGSFRCEGVLDSDETGPVWVKCDDDTNNDGLCDRWTISTADLTLGPDELPSPARACLKERDVLVNTGVRADFEMKVCVLGLEGCPDPAWEP